MGFITKLFGGKKSQQKGSLESLADLLAPDEIDAKSDYGMASTISSDIDSIALDIGPHALEETTVTLNHDGEVSVVFMTTPFEPSKEVKAFFCLKDYDKLPLLKRSAGKRDDTNYIVVDIAGREILKKLQEQIK